MYCIIWLGLSFVDDWWLDCLLLIGWLIWLCLLVARLLVVGLVLFSFLLGLSWV